jgi:hypothetical protein
LLLIRPTAALSTENYFLKIITSNVREPNIDNFNCKFDVNVSAGKGVSLAI